MDASVQGAESTKKYIFFDPGLTTGVAIFDHRGEITDLLEVRGIEAFAIFLEDLDPQEFAVVGYEKFNLDGRVKGDKSYTRNRCVCSKLMGSDMPASQAIGLIRGWIYRHALADWKGERHWKSAGYAWWGQIQKSHGAKLQHAEDAASLGVYYLVKKGIRLTHLERKPSTTNPPTLADILNSDL